MWQTILEKDILDKDSNFFQNGGDSLKAIRLVNALKEELGIEPKISWLLKHQLFQNLQHEFSRRWTQTIIWRMMAKYNRRA